MDRVAPTPDDLDALDRLVTIDGAFDFEFGDYPDDDPQWPPLRAIATGDEKTFFVSVGRAQILYAFDVSNAAPELADVLQLPPTMAGDWLDLELWGQDRLVVVGGHALAVVNIADPFGLELVGTASFPEAAEGKPKATSPVEIWGACVLHDRYAVVARAKHDTPLGDVTFIEVAGYSGADVVDLERINGEMGIITPDFHLETPWLSPTDCVVDASDQIFFTDKDGAGYWPMSGNIVLGAVGLMSVLELYTTIDEVMQVGGEPDFSSFTWTPPPESPCDQTSLDTFADELNDVRDTLKDGVFMLGDLMIPRDPPGPFLISYGMEHGMGDLRGDGPIYLRLTEQTRTEALTLLEQLRVAMLGDPASGSEPDTELGADILLNQMRPHYCWRSNPWHGGVDDFRTDGTECVLVMPRLGLEAIFFLEALLDSNEDFEVLLARAHQQMLERVAYSNPIEGGATLAAYNIQLVREHTWLHNRISFGFVGQLHMIDFSTPSAIGETIPPPSWCELKPLLEQIRQTLEQAAAVDLARDGRLSVGHQDLITDDFAANLLPLDFGSAYRYPSASQSDPNAADYHEQQGERFATWGTRGLEIESRLLTYPTIKAVPVPGDRHWVAVGTQAGWDILTRGSDPLENLLHIGADFPADIDGGFAELTFPVRFHHRAKVLEDSPPGWGADVVALDSRTIALIEYGSEDRDRDGMVHLFDIASMDRGADPVLIWRGTPEQRSRLLAGVGLPNEGLIFVIGPFYDRDGERLGSKIWRIATDVPYTE